MVKYVLFYKIAIDVRIRFHWERENVYTVLHLSRGGGVASKLDRNDLIQSVHLPQCVLSIISILTHYFHLSPYISALWSTLRLLKKNSSLEVEKAMPFSPVQMWQ